MAPTDPYWTTGPVMLFATVWNVDSHGRPPAVAAAAACEISRATAAADMAIETVGIELPPSAELAGRAVRFCANRPFQPTRCWQMGRTVEWVKRDKDRGKSVISGRE